MARLANVCRHIRSKNAGPFWIPIDLFFRDDDAYRSCKDDPNISPGTFAEMFGVDKQLIKLVRVDSIRRGP